MAGQFAGAVHQHALRVAGQGGHGVGIVNHGGRHKGRGRSPSLKRKNPEDEAESENMNDGYQTVTRKPRKFANGTSQVGLEDIAPGGLAGPVDFYIGNTDNRADGDIILHVLKKCAAPLEGGADLEVLEVELLTAEENPRTKCWRVSVPFKYRSLMEKDDLYPPGWKHRKFFGTRKNDMNNTAKRGRLEVDQVAAMIQKLKP